MPAYEADPLFSLAGRTALVTGASRGLGLMIARGFVERGARVVLLSRTAEALERAVTELAGLGPVRALVADLARMEEIARVADVLHADVGRLDILVNNAAAVWNAPFESFPAEGWDKVANLNVRSPFFLTQALLPLIRNAATSSPPARIINVASTDALHVPLTDTYSYTAAKAGLVMLTRMLARRLGPEQITVNALAPGPFHTRMTARRIETHPGEFESQIPLGRLGTPEDIIGAAVFLASRAGAYVSGSVLAVDGGWVGGL